jgi:hypothetical protein
MDHLRGKEVKVKRILLPILIIGILLLSAWAVSTTAPPTQQQTYTLSVCVSPSGAGFVSCPGNEYEPGVQVMLTAIPASGYAFDYWNGDASGSSATTTIIMDSDKSIIAHFKALPAPVFSKVQIYDILESTTTIQWSTNEPATFQVEYGISKAYGSVTSDTVWKDATDWGRVTLTELKSETTYHFRICAVDKDGNQAFSDDYTFTTLAPKALFSARLFPFVPGHDASVLLEEYYWVMRLNTNLFNGSSQTITVTKVEFLYEDGDVAFTLPISVSTMDESDYISPTLGRSDLPDIWKNWRLASGRSLFTGIEFERVQPSVRELEGWQVKWYCLDAHGIEFTVTGEFSLLP